LFYNQPLGARFGTELIGHLTSGTWGRLDIAVAWVRASGIRHLLPSLNGFLSAGNRLRIIVGVDLDNTTVEGLQTLLDLQKVGDAQTTVYHNEISSIFHPKLYLFSNAKRAKLIVGSNNITEAGLYTNTEAGLEIEDDVDSEIIKSAVGVLDTWSDGALGVSKKLDSLFLADLIAAGYVKTEAVVRAEFAARKAAAKSAASKAKKLFSSIPVTPPPTPTVASSAAASGVSKKPATKKAQPPAVALASGQVLLMRLRKAHPVNRPTQTQIPIAVARSAFFGSITSVISTHDGQTHEVRKAIARGILNTLKLEIPEMRNMQDPVARFERTGPTSIHYQVYDRASPKGSTILASLKAGLAASPPSTQLTVPSAPESATWWRFI
jgi:HKD family nuclease